MARGFAVLPRSRGEGRVDPSGNWWYKGRRRALGFWARWPVAHPCTERIARVSIREWWANLSEQQKSVYLFLVALILLTLPCYCLGFLALQFSSTGPTRPTATPTVRMTVSPTATASPTAIVPTPAASPSPSPTASATPTSVPSATPTPTLTPEPSPSPTLTPTPEATPTEAPAETPTPGLLTPAPTAPPEATPTTL